MYNVHPYFSLKTLGKSVCKYHGKLWYIVFLSTNMLYVSLFLRTSFMFVNYLYYIYDLYNLFIHLNNVYIIDLSLHMLCIKYIIIFK